MKQDRGTTAVEKRCENTSIKTMANPHIHILVFFELIGIYSTPLAPRPTFLLFTAIGIALTLLEDMLNDHFWGVGGMLGVGLLIYMSQPPHPPNGHAPVSTKGVNSGSCPLRKRTRSYQEDMAQTQAEGFPRQLSGLLPAKLAVSLSQIFMAIYLYMTVQHDTMLTGRFQKNYQDTSELRKVAKRVRAGA